MYVGIMWGLTGADAKGAVRQQGTGTESSAGWSRRIRRDYVLTPTHTPSPSGTITLSNLFSPAITSLKR